MKEAFLLSRVVAVLASLRLAVVVMVTLGSTCAYATFYETLHGSFPVVFEKRRPQPGEEQRFPVPGSDVTLVAEAWEPHVEVAESFEPGASGPPALHFVLQAPLASQDGWLVPDDPSRSHLDLGMVAFGFHTASTAEEARQVARTVEGRNHLTFVLGPDGKLLYGAAGSSGDPQTGVVQPGQPLKTPWPAMGVT